MLIGILLVACGEPEKTAEEGAPPAEKQLEPIRLAVVGPHSGDLASYGIPTIKAAELVVEHRNSMNGVNNNLNNSSTESASVQNEAINDEQMLIAKQNAYVELNNFITDRYYSDIIDMYFNMFGGEKHKCF